MKMGNILSGEKDEIFGKKLVLIEKRRCSLIEITKNFATEKSSKIKSMIRRSSLQLK
jgi:hypothetical protein